MKTFKIIEKRNLWFVISLIVILSGFSLIANKAIKTEPALNYGIDFVGGTTMLLKFENAPEDTSQFISEIRETLKSFNLEKSAIQVSNKNEAHIKTLELKGNEHKEITTKLEENIGKFEILEIDFIGPTIGNELRQTSFWIILVASIALLIYISIRFQFTYGIAALIALIHDALVTISIAALLNLEINTAFVAAILTILGYSINDTIVIFDRIRENARKLSESTTFNEIINISLSQTLIRTLNTSMTTIIIISSLIFLGGTTIKEFCIVLLIGVLAGTYSSLFVASPALSLLNKSEETQA
jgi:preprotein translocase subunit SecF